MWVIPDASVRAATAQSRRYRSLAMDTEGAQLPVLEFWPDYGPGPLWLGNGKAADLDSLGLSIDLVARLRAYNAAYR